MSEQITPLAGSIVSISPNLPASYNQASFEAVTGLIEVKQAISLSGGGFTMEESSYVLLKDGSTVQRPGVKTYNPYEMEFQDLPSDPGQSAYKNLALNRQPMTLKIEFSNGDIEYTVARGNGFTPAGGAAGDFRNATVSFWQDEKGAIVVPGAGTSTFTLAYTAGANGSILGATPQTVVRGNDGSPVAAVPAATYKFVQWSDGSTQNPRVDTFINGNISVTATFALI